MAVNKSTINGDGKSILITGANSGLGFDATAQLAVLGYSKIILACHTLAKAEEARKLLVARTGVDPFETIAIDVSSIASAGRAADELIELGQPIDQLLLNAGMVPGDTMYKSEDDIEITFASSLIGHHILANRLLETNLIKDEGRIILVSSEGARNDLPAAMGLKLYDFAMNEPKEFGSNLHEAMTVFAKGEGKPKYDGMRYYGTTKLFSAWWASELAERTNGKVSVFAVSPGASLKTNAARNVKGLKRFIFTKVMPLLGPYLGLDQPVDVAAKRYVDVLTAPKGEFVSGRSYMSVPNKMVGPMVEQTYAHLGDQTRREIAWRVLDELTGRSKDAKSATPA